MTKQLTRIADILEPAAQHHQRASETRPTPCIAFAVEVREPCPYCPPPAMIPRAQLAEHIAVLHTGPLEDNET